MSALLLIQTFCALSFFGYGISCLLSEHMVREFQRYGIPQFRKLTGLLQILAAIGLLVGMWLPFIGAIAAGGLSLQMACGLVVRIRIQDPLFQCLPATTDLILCGWLATALP